MPDRMPDRNCVVTVLVDSLMAPDSPRLNGENVDHVKVLAETATELPPIIVHRATMRVIDGMHRLRAATLRGERRIAVRFFDGDEKAAFVLAVEANVAHGLPLTLAERTAAAARIMSSFPEWSNRAIAAVTGLSDKTVGAVRRRIGDEIPQSNHRIGRDGRERPLSAADGRARAGELLAEKPSASLREIARLAGVSPGTVRNVRQRMRQSEDVVPTGKSTAVALLPSAASSTADRRIGPRDPRSVLRALSNDPSLRFSQSGKALLRWLHTNAADVAEWPKLVDDMPGHVFELIADLARGCAEEWLELADALERRARSTA